MLIFETADGRRIAKPLFGSNIDIKTVRFNLGTTIVELNSKDHPGGSKTLDVLLQQNLDSNYIADYPHPIGGASESQEMAILSHAPSDPEKGRTGGEVSKEEPQKDDFFEKKMRGWMMILATLFASMTFQAGLNPPGGVWQDDQKGHTAGTFILQQKSFGRYVGFSFCNSLAFVYSIMAVFMMLSKTYYLVDEESMGLRVIMIPNILLIVVAFAVGSSRDKFSTIAPLCSMLFMLIYFGSLIYREKRKQKGAKK